MSGRWTDSLAKDPRPALLAWPDPALAWFVRRDLLAEPVGPVEPLWDLPEAKRLVAKQQPDGSWRYPPRSNHPAPNANYDLLETYRSLRILVEMYGYRRDHPALARAAEYVFSCQTEEGDLRGILGNQAMPYYHGGLLTLLIHAGYGDDPRLKKGLVWLLAMRQEDGGWIIPAQALPAGQKTPAFWLGPTLPPDRRLPSSHLATDMALRAFAAHPTYRSHPDVLAAADMLKSRLFKADKYTDRKGPGYWFKFQYPFWWPSLVTALDSLSRLGFVRQDREIAGGLDWFLSNQSADGLWETGYGSGRQAEGMRRWVGLAICRVLKRFFDQD